MLSVEREILRRDASPPCTTHTPITHRHVAHRTVGPAINYQQRVVLREDCLGDCDAVEIPTPPKMVGAGSVVSTMG